MRHLQSSLQPVSSSKLYLTIKKSKIKMMAKSTLAIWRLRGCCHNGQLFFQKSRKPLRSERTQMRNSQKFNSHALFFL